MNEDVPIENQIEGLENDIPNSPREFHLEMPLYKKIVIKEENLEKLSELIDFNGTIDAYCIYCGKESVFENYDRPGFGLSALRVHAKSAKSEPKEYFETSYVCSRSRAHQYTSYFRICGSVIQKVGQFPSVADLQIPQIQKYRKLLGNEKYKEFTRALGLAAHGVGIGSFVYLRRIFEDLIERAHLIASQNPKFNESKYRDARIEEKILLLKDLLPDFLVKHRSIYKILSKGIHELSEEECLKYFNPIRVGIELILDRKLKEIDEKEKEKEASETISRIAGELKTNNPGQGGPSEN